ncbi:flagellin N-terminal helical domain-containing protein [Anaeromicrobium sediminis]|uniref:Flagellin n=1 Tax=Anaeromicrobium sediminis TaxID=1478221 RepID=A0A267MIF4_9FIRM|nr:flagellin [Anaeromicrobium sediminis]PAB59364.1 hypothetical protein CCE28_10925 [Anaeromicrobium sediminis]
MRINNNLMAMNTHRQMGVNQGNSAKSIEKLSSGLRINRAGDDAAGLSISEKMRSQIRGLNQASRNAQDGISMVQTAEGALQETQAILQRMRELSVQASTDALDTEDRTAIGEELVALRDEIDRIGETAEFNGKKLLKGTLATTFDGTSDVKAGTAVSAKATISDVDVTGGEANTTYAIAQGASGAGYVALSANGTTQEIQLTDAMFDTLGEETVLDFDKLGVKITLTSSTAGSGGEANTVETALSALTSVKTLAGSSTANVVVGSNATADETIQIGFDDMRASALHTDLGTLTNTAVADVTTAKALTGKLDTALTKVSKQRSELGAFQNRLEHSIKNLDASSENLTAAESRIRDVDMAKEMMKFQKNNILSQAAQSMLAQANQQPQGVLQLLR